MAEVIEPGVLKTPTPRRKFKVDDSIVLAVLAVVIIALLVTLLGKLSLKHEVSGARTVADRLINDIAKQNTTDVRSLGDTKFQAKNSTEHLQQLFTEVAAVAKGTPHVDRQMVANSAKTDTVYVLYRYSSKNPYYVRVAISKVSGTDTWHLVGISGSNNEASLIIK